MGSGVASIRSVAVRKCDTVCVTTDIPSFIDVVEVPDPNVSTETPRRLEVLVELDGSGTDMVVPGLVGTPLEGIGDTCTVLDVQRTLLEKSC